jgi:hypothetical protein
MKTSDRFLQLAALGDMTMIELAEALGVSKQRVSQLGKRHGVKFKGAPKGPRPQPPEFAPNRWGGQHKVSPTWVGCAGELLVAADMIRRGYAVYHSMARTGPFDLYAYADGEGLRIEVRSIRSETQQPANGSDWTAFDVLARVLPCGRILYDPDMPD